MTRLVLLHGFAATNFTWRDVIGPLRAAHDVVALERRFGALPETIENTARDLETRDDGVVLVGHSSGAELALHVAARNSARVRALVLAAPVVGGGPPPLARLVAGAPVVRAVAPSLLRAGIRVGLGRALRQTWSDKSRVTAEVVEGYREPLLRGGVAESLWAMTAAERPPDPEWSRLLDTPALVIVGARDKWATVPPLPQVEVVTYENCGHLPHEECPERFVADVLAFLSSPEVA